MKARLVKFGEIEVEGKRYTHDMVIDGGKVAEAEERIFQAIPRKVRATGTSKAPLTLNQRNVVSRISLPKSDLRSDDSAFVSRRRTGLKFSMNWRSQEKATFR
jgi:hypothetical protein